MAKLETIEGIGQTFARKLDAAGVKSVAALLSGGATAKGRREIAEKAGLREADVLRIVNHADLMRIKGIGGEYAGLLEAAGVDTVAELARRNAANLYVAMSATNHESRKVRQLPTGKQVTDWVAQARTLPRVVEY